MTLRLSYVLGLAALSGLALGAAVAAVPSAQPGAVPASPACADTPCRTGQTRIELNAADGQHKYALDLDPTPYVLDGTIRIYPGETLIFRFKPGADGPGDPVFVTQIAGHTPQHLMSESDPDVEKYHDPKTGEDYYIDRGHSARLDGGTAADHLKDQPPGTMIVSYHQLAGHADMVLTVEHNLDRPLKYDARIDRLQPDGDAGLEATSTCPASPVMLANETWPYPIGTITLSHFRFATGSSFSCE